MAFYVYIRTVKSKNIHSLDILDNGGSWNWFKKCVVFAQNELVTRPFLRTSWVI